MSVGSLPRAPAAIQGRIRFSKRNPWLGHLLINATAPRGFPGRDLLGSLELLSADSWAEVSGAGAAGSSGQGGVSRWPGSGGCVAAAWVIT